MRSGDYLGAGMAGRDYSKKRKRYLAYCARQPSGKWLTNHQQS